MVDSRVQEAGSAWPWDEHTWRARLDQVNEWIWNELQKTNPELTGFRWGFIGHVEAELQPHPICDVALWLRDVLEGSALIAEEGLRLTDGLESDVSQGA